MNQALEIDRIQLDSEPTLMIHREKDGLGLYRMDVAIDGISVGRIARGRVGSYRVAEGDHPLVLRIVSFHFGPIPLHFEAGDRLAIRCISNQPPLHRWHVHAFWFLMAFSALHKLGGFFPAVGKFVDENLLIELFVTLGLGLAGMIAYFREAYRSGAHRGTWLHVGVESDRRGHLFNDWVAPT